ncbi:MAG: HAMP domain-containing histidine kinase [Brachyspira sp.]|nr:HAMP domain-containing histidine kinase [Brachyspira sp.]
MPTEILKEQSRCIAHEIRNQVSICDVYCEIIKKQLLKEGIKNESIERAIECIQKSVKMVNNSLIDLKSLDNIKQTVCNTNNLIEQSIKMGRVYIHDKLITISSNLKSDAEIYVDENKFLACMINLIKNAIEAIDTKGEIIVTSDIEKEFAVIRISNNGKPISKTAQKDLFNEGYTTKKTGSGLGLYICQNNLKLQNAELSLIQSTTKKTEFEIKIPIIK